LKHNLPHNRGDTKPSKNMNIINSIVAAVARVCGYLPLHPTATMANALDHKSMLYKLLGCDDSTPEDMVNSRFTAAMEVEPDPDDKKKAEELAEANAKLTAANEAKEAAAKKAGELELQAANEAKAKGEAEAKIAQAAADLEAANKTIAESQASFANERAARVKLVLDAKVTAGHITGAERKDFEAEFANAFDATLAKLEAKQSTKLPAQRQAGMAGIGARQRPDVLAGKDRRDKISEMVNEESKKPCYRHLENDRKYSEAFTAVLAAHPELKEAK